MLTMATMSTAKSAVVLCAAGWSSLSSAGPVGMTQPPKIDGDDCLAALAPHLRPQPTAVLLWNQQQWRPIIALLIRRIEVRVDRIGIPLVPRRIEEIARFDGTECDKAHRLRAISLLRQGSARYYQNSDDNRLRAGGVSACPT